MNLVARLSWARRARVVSEALAAARADGLVAIVDCPPLARALHEDGRAVALLTPRERTLRRFPGSRVRATAGALPLAAGTLGALVAAGSATLPDWAALWDEWRRALRDGGAFVLVDVAAREELSRRVLCAGFVDPEQRLAGRTVVTSARALRL